MQYLARFALVKPCPSALRVILGIIRLVYLSAQKLRYVPLNESENSKKIKSLLDKRAFHARRILHACIFYGIIDIFNL